MMTTMHSTPAGGVIPGGSAEVVVEALNPIRTRTLELMDDKAELLKLLKAGSEKANQVAAKTLADVYSALGLIANG